MTESVSEKDHIVVFCVRCNLPVGNMSIYDIGLKCREICVPCYEYLLDRTAKYEKMIGIENDR